MTAFLFCSIIFTEAPKSASSVKDKDPFSAAYDHDLLDIGPFAFFLDFFAESSFGAFSPLYKDSHLLLLPYFRGGLSPCVS
jgi:hypothetical protein